MKVVSDSGMQHQIIIIKNLFHDEETERDQADEELGRIINTEIENREDSDSELGEKIDKEIQDRQGSDAELDEKIDQIKQDIENSLINYATKDDLSNIPKFAIEVVQSLPTENISNTTVYLLPGNGDVGNLYTEYIYVNNTWEILGSQKFDLTGYATEDWVRGILQDYALTSDVYTKRESDSKFATKEELSTKADTSDVYSKEELDIKIDNVKNDIETALTNYATKDEVSVIPKFAIEVVEELPTTDISNTTVYLVKSSDDIGNLYTEYVYINDKWEEFGTQDVNLTGYATETWVQNLIQQSSPATMSLQEAKTGEGTIGKLITAEVLDKKIEDKVDLEKVNSLGYGDYSVKIIQSEHQTITAIMQYKWSFEGTSDFSPVFPGVPDVTAIVKADSGYVAGSPSVTRNGRIFVVSASDAVKQPIQITTVYNIQNDFSALKNPTTPHYIISSFCPSQVDEIDPNETLIRNEDGELQEDEFSRILIGDNDMYGYTYEQDYEPSSDTISTINIPVYIHIKPDMIPSRDNPEQPVYSLCVKIKCQCVGQEFYLCPDGYSLDSDNFAFVSNLVFESKMGGTETGNAVTGYFTEFEDTLTLTIPSELQDLIATNRNLTLEGTLFIKMKP